MLRFPKSCNRIRDPKDILFTQYFVGVKLHYTGTKTLDVDYYVGFSSPTIVRTMLKEYPNEVIILNILLCHSKINMHLGDQY